MNEQFRKKLRKISVLTIAVIVGIMSTTACGGGVGDNEVNTTNLSGFEDAFNKENVYKEDFYQYVNGEWISNTTLNAEEYIKTPINDIAGLVNYRVYSYLEEISKTENLSKLDTASVEYKMGVLYKQIKDSKEKGIEADKIKEILNKVESVKTFEELQELYNSEEFAVLNRLIKIDVENLGGKGTYNVVIRPVDLYNVSSSITTEQSQILKENIKLELELLGYEAAKAERISTEASILNSNICNYLGSMNSDYGYININSLDSRIKNISLVGMLDSLDYKSSTNIIFIDENYLSLLRQLYVEENIEMIKSYHIVSIIHSLIYAMPENIYEVYASTDEKIMNVTYKKDDTQYALNMMGIMPDAIEKFYENRYISDKIKTDLIELSEDIRQTFIGKIDSLDWMEDSTKSAAKKKIENIQVYALESGDYNQYEDATIIDTDKGGNAVDNCMNILLSNMRYKREKMDKEADREKINIDVLDTNLYYMPNANAIIICAGMISDDTINETMSYEERLGKIGSMIAHEFGHAIDANGCYFDENGISKSWWTSSDFTKFSQRVNKVKNYFNGMDVVDDVKINGELIKSEAMADLTSMMCCLELLKNKEDVNYKTFFESYAKMYKQVANQEYEKYLAMVDSHLPSSFRVNHIINQFEEFYTTYGIKEGDKMYIEPEDRINIF